MTEEIWIPPKSMEEIRLERTKFRVFKLEKARRALKEIHELANRTPIILATTSPDDASCGTGIMKIRRLAAEALEATNG